MSQQPVYNSKWGELSTTATPAPPYGGMMPGGWHGMNESPMGRLSASYGISLFVRRWAATSIDALLFTGLFLSMIAVPEVFRGIHFILLIAVVILYYLLLEGLTGFTAGKLVLRIQAVDSRGGAPGLAGSLIRSLVRLFELNPFILFGLPACIAVLASRKNQRLGDMGANTFVVRTKDLAPNSKARMTVVIIIVCIMVLLSIISAAASVVKSIRMPSAGDTQYISKDGMFRVTAKADWSEQRALAEDADLSLGSRSLGGKYFVLFSESKSGFYEGVTLDDYTYFVEEYYGYELEDSPLYWPLSLEVNGYPAYQFAYESYDNGEWLTYVITTVETQGHFHQLIVWTTSERYEDTKNELFELIESFTEVQRRYVV